MASVRTMSIAAERNIAEHDLIIQLTKRDLPSGNGPNEFVCLGHFDYAKIEEVPNTSSDGFKEFRNIDSLSKIHSESKDPEGMIRNYLFNSGKYGKGGSANEQSFSFLFMMTTAVSQNNGGSECTSLEPFADEYASELNSIVDGITEWASTDSIFWEIYYPISRGDIIILLRSNTFEKATEILSKFAKSLYVRYSYTIPMVAWNWLQSEDADLNGKKCHMRLRITAKDYNCIDAMLDSLQSNTTALFTDPVPKKYASFGTDDIELYFGIFNENKLKEYLKFITNPEHQQMYREMAMFSAEIDIPRDTSD